MRKRTLALAVVLGLLLVTVVVNWTWGDLPDEPPARGQRATVGDVELRYVERDGGAPGLPPVEVAALHRDREQPPLVAGVDRVGRERPLTRPPASGSRPTR